MGRTLRSGGLWLLALITLLFPALGGAQEEGLEQLELAELMQVEVVTASRRTEPLTQVAGAVTVLDEEDIFHSGAKTIPELLKLVPGLHVAQVDTDKWAIGIRGFNGILSNKHLVLVDGRPVTSPTTTGVDWGSLVPVSMVKRVEVVRGTWTHLWGSDSFTGVINIITKTAEETQGGQSITTAGTSGIEQLVRYGGEMNETGFWRGYVKGGYVDGNMLSGDDKNKESKDWVKWQGGIRADWENAYTDLLSFQGDLVFSTIEDNAGGGPQVQDPKMRESVNGYGQLTWNRATGLESGVNFRSSYTREATHISDMSGHTNTLDAELEYAVEQIGIHRLTWGAGARYYWDHVKDGDKARLESSSYSTFSSNGYIQDRLEVVEDSLFLTLGTKLDYYGRGDVEFQPTARLLHTRVDKEFWLAVSRAVRADNRMQREASYDIRYKGEVYNVEVPSTLNPETLYSYETGFRHRVSPDFQYDASVYVNDYKNLIMLEYDSSTKTASLDNSLKGTTYGLELSGMWGANEWLSFKPMVSVIYQKLYGKIPLPSNESMPEQGWGNEIKLQTLTKPTSSTGFDFLVGYVNSPTDNRLPGYFILEAHGSWRASETVMVELLARNLGESTTQYSHLKVGPSVDLRLTWDF